MRATPVLSAVALASCRGGGVTVATTTAAATAAVAPATTQPLSTSAGRTAARMKSSRKRGGRGRGGGGGGGGGGRQERGVRSRGGSSSISRRTGLLFQCLSTSPSSSSSRFSSSAMRGGPTRIPRRSVHTTIVDAAGKVAAGGRRGGRRLGTHEEDRHQQLLPSFSTAADASAALRSRTSRRLKSRRPLTMMMMASTSPVTDKDIMREFVTVAASEAAASVKNKPPSSVLNGDSKQSGAPTARATPAAAAGKEVGEGGVDDARPTGYRYGDVLTDADGLPLVYDSDSIGRYWDKRPGELNGRWTKFLSVTVPFVTRVVKDYTSGNIMKNEATLARDLRVVIEKLGPTFIKLGQALSIRPDVIGPAATDELAKLQDAVPPFPTPLAMELLEEELGRPSEEIFSELSEEPIAAASLAQVYRGVLRSNGQAVAVKVQRPGLVQEVTKDLYVLKRAVAVYQNLSERFTAQMTDYNELLRVWATGFYQELDFLNEANNQIRMKKVLHGMKGQVFVPDVLLDLSTRRVLISEWVDGVKLTKADPSEIRELTSIAQEAFLVQLLGEGFMHCDPHPGNMLLVDESSRGERGRLALLDYGLMAELGSKEREGMVSALIHTANRDYKSLIEDLVELEVLPANTDRGQVEPVMKRVIGPYVFEGGGAKSLNYQSLARDLARATLEIPFNIPPYFALIARALGILEGVALTGDPDYRIVMEAYPFVTRKIISDDSPALQRALRDILYTEDGKFLAKRLSVLLSYATGVVAADSAVFVDFDTLPSSAASLSQTLKFLLADEARPLRAALVGEASNAADLILRRGTRQAVVRAKDLLRPPPPPLPFLPRLPSLPFPVPESVVDTLSPKLTVEEDIFLASLEELAYALAGLEQGAVSDDPLEAIRQLLQTGIDGSSGIGELAEFVQTLPGDSQKTGAILEVGSEVVRNLAKRASTRFGGLVGGAGSGGDLDRGTSASAWKEGKARGKRAVQRGAGKMIVEAMTTLAAEDKNGSSIRSIANRVEQVTNASVADRAGVRAGDIVEAVGGCVLVRGGGEELEFSGRPVQADKPNQRSPSTSPSAEETDDRDGDGDGDGNEAGKGTGTGTRNSKGKWAQTAPGAASGVGWVSHTGVVASMDRRADGEGGLGKPAAGGAARAAARAAGEASTPEGGSPTKARKKGKGSASQKTQDGRADGGSESRRKASGVAVTSFGARALGAASTPDGAGPTKARKTGKGSAEQMIQDRGLGGGSESRRVAAGPSVIGTTGNLPFRPREAAGAAFTPEGDSPTEARKEGKGSAAKANQMPGRGAPGGQEREEHGVEKTKGGETVQQQSSSAVPPGAFLLTGFSIGTRTNRIDVPAGAQLLDSPLYALSKAEVFEYGSNFYGSIQDVVWPRRLRVLQFRNTFDEPVVDVSWPPSLQRLEFGFEFDQPVDRVSWPPCLQELAFGFDFDQPVDGVSWPPSLRQLTFGHCFNQPVHGVSWPPSLRRLSFGTCFDQAVQGVAWPSLLQELKFGRRFNQPVGGVSWPASLEALTFGDYREDYSAFWSSFNQAIDEAVWPASLRRLTLGGSFDQSLVGLGSWVPRLQELTILNDTASSSNGMILVGIEWPKGLKRLRMRAAGKGLREKLLIPPTVEVPDVDCFDFPRVCSQFRNAHGS
eukprot:g7536.t1